MKKFRVFIRGENFFMKADGVVKRMGFYTTRYVEGVERDDAERRAIDSLRQLNRLRESLLNDPANPPLLFAEEIEEIDSFEGIESLEPGLVMFDDESTIH